MVVPTIWSQGDDGLTLRLRDAVEAVFAKAEEPLRVAPGPDKLLIKVSNWRDAGSRTLVRYTVRFYRDGREVGRHGGECWDSAMSSCADQILRADKALP